ncbi:MAG: DUF4249 domain-containing protein [Bacteroidales bacterium]|nr:DUF4249 domain-containing protein [Bacteroidales bacterium]
MILLTAGAGCVTQFYPDIAEEDQSIVIEALITDRAGPHEVRISWSQPLFADDFYQTPADGYMVSVLDDAGNEYIFNNIGGGRYLSDETEFHATAGMKYKLHIEGANHTYESDFVEMKPVPVIDSVYAGPEYNEFYKPGESTYGYQVYIDSHDPTGESRYFMWTFAETWEIRTPFNYWSIINRICWKSAASTDINILSTETLTESRVTKHPVTFITRETDRLTVKYSILVSQYSITGEEFTYRDNLRKTVFEAGGLYDAIPGAIRGNINCTDSPATTVLGFFSVSSVSEERLFIENVYTQFPDFYAYCPIDTIRASDYKPDVYGPNVYILGEWLEPPLPVYYILSIHRECIDCSLSGTAVKPDYWDSPGQKKIYHSLFDENKR